MKSKWAKITAFFMAGVMLLSGCASGTPGGTDQVEGTGSDTGETSTAESISPAGNGEEEVVLNIRLMNDITNIDKVLDVFYDKVKDDPVLGKVKLNFSYVAGADYSDKFTLTMAAKEDFDMIFVQAWKVDGYAQDGCFVDLTPYFNNDEYPGLKAAFSENYINANMQGDKLYAVPITESFSDIAGIAYREDLRKKYDCPEIVDVETFETYLKTLNEHLDEEGLVAPWGVTSHQGLAEWLVPTYEELRNNIFTVGNFKVAISEDNKQVINAVIAGDDPSMFEGFPEGFDKDWLTEWYCSLPYWVDNYCNPDPYSTQDDIQAMFDVGLYGAVYATATEWLTRLENLKLNEVEGAELGFFTIDEKQRNMEKGAIVNSMKAWNFLCLPEWSEKTEYSIAFLDWMFSSRENHDLFQYGIEGTDWEAIGDNAYRTLDVPQAEAYTLPGYTFTWNPTYVRYSENVINNEQVKKVFDYQSSEDSYTLSLLSGLSFTTQYESESTAVNAIYNEMLFKFGAYGDETTQKVAEFHEQLEAAGIEKLREEVITAVQDYLDAQQ